MTNKSNMYILMRDQVVDVVCIDRSMLGAQIRFMKRLPRDEDVFEAAAGLMKTADRMPTRIMLCIPRSFIIQRTLRYPAAVKEDLASMVQLEAARHVPLPEEERLLAYAAADSPEDMQVVLNLVAARKGEIQALVDRFAETGIPVDETVSYSSLVAPALAGVPTLLVMADAEQIELCLYYQGILQDSQLLSRNTPGFSDDRLIIAARQMAVKHKAWLGDEGISRIIAGGAVPLKDVCREELGAAFGLHVHSFEVPDEWSALAEDEDALLTEVLLAASAGKTPTLNLIEDQQRRVPLSTRTILVASLCALFVIEVLAASVLATTAPSRLRKKVATEIRGMQEDTADIQLMRDRNRVFRKQLYQLEQVCGTRASSMEILKVVSDTLPEDTYLRQIECSPEEIRLRGYSKAPDRLPERVMAMPFVDTISTSDIGSERNGYYEFTLSASLRR